MFVQCTSIIMVPGGANNNITEGVGGKRILLPWGWK